MFQRVVKRIAAGALSLSLSRAWISLSLSRTIARNLKFTGICILLCRYKLYCYVYVMYPSYLINIIGSVKEQIPVYLHKVSFTSGSYSFLDASFLITLLHHNLTSNHVFIDMFSHHIFIFNIHFHNSIQIFIISITTIPHPQHMISKKNIKMQRHLVIAFCVPGCLTYT